MTVKLSQAGLNRLPANVGVPAYGRSDLSAGIVHFGIGNFHRAHQAVYLDALFNAGVDRDWGIIGAGVLPSDETMRQKLKEQDWLTTVVEQDSGHRVAHVTGAMIDYLEPGNEENTIARLADPAIRIVSMTITEGGYFIDPASGHFNPQHPAIVADAQAIDRPKTVFGLILAGLIRRRNDNTPPFTVMSCDNIPGNGHVTCDAVSGLAELVDGNLAEWVREHVAFPNSMVDRITPATSDRERQLLQSEFGIEDNWPVFCEPFKQWVLEDHFPIGRPSLDRVGVTFVKDVAPYELMKIRILNGGHAAIAYPAALMDIHFVHEAMEEPLIRDFLTKLETEEIIPVLPPVPDMPFDEYFDLIVRRFSNPKIGDTIQRLCQDGSNRQPKFILPTTADRLKAGRSITGLSLVSALWCRFCAGTTDSGQPTNYLDASAERLKVEALKAKDDPKAFLAMTDIFGEVGTTPVFVESFSRILRTLWQEGARETLKLYLDDRL
ncbi:mannitol dehydrogenase family protein [Phyllobacterium sp. 0TCS1.6C]|uniref:mannitol dehydrogenase family protein n=1 Tax=unclassified Phyllobacterium TaxID=2638441 RepID=UPI002263E657|nr:MULTISPECIES: mannitol dehydrogenase family protein [unclassified Phyllobacterium]MCX8278620.1 mannitol dehydrogenase family protein [Phyllobacterium sp. 0TCS1.6C]MCX8293550.1 mannitol dehydrogenase family protein [Phyllobacterium sp. 0TCS1.6A]